MNLLSLFRRKNSAPVARERLQLLLAHERSVLGGQPDLVAILREEILAVISKHLSVASEKVNVKMNLGNPISTLAVDIEMPGTALAA